MLYLLAGLLLGIPLALPTTALPAWVQRATPGWLHLLVVGWLTQLIFGVAFWMFPRHPSHPPRGRPALAWLAYLCLNVGLLLRVIGEPFLIDQAWQTPALAAAVLQFVAAASWVVLMWPRAGAR